MLSFSPTTSSNSPSSVENCKSINKRMSFHISIHYSIYKKHFECIPSSKYEFCVLLKSEVMLFLRGLPRPRFTFHPFAKIVNSNFVKIWFENMCQSIEFAFSDTFFWSIFLFAWSASIPFSFWSDRQTRWNWWPLRIAWCRRLRTIICRFDVNKVIFWWTGATHLENHKLKW